MIDKEQLKAIIESKTFTGDDLKVLLELAKEYLAEQNAKVDVKKEEE